MPRAKSPSERVAGRLISVIQKEWGKELGESNAEQAEDVLDKAHDILQAVKCGQLAELLNGISLSGYLGESWIDRHGAVRDAIAALDKELLTRKK